MVPKWVKVEIRIETRVQSSDNGSTLDVPPREFQNFYDKYQTLKIDFRKQNYWRSPGSESDVNLQLPERPAIP